MKRTPPDLPISRRFEWRRSLRWFAAELAIVVVGILVALALNAWWANRQNSAREVNYLRQIAANLRAAEADLEESEKSARSLQRSAALLLREFYTPGSASPDSLRQWLWDAPWFASHGAELGSLRTLAASDLQILRDDSVRNGALELLSRMESYAPGERYAIEHFHASYLELRNEVSFVEGLVADLGRTSADSLARSDQTFPAPVGAGAHPFPTELDAFFRSRSAYKALEGIWETNSDIGRLQQARRREVRQFRELVERVLARHES